MIYTYPKSQSIFRNSLFLMKETVDSKKFTEYRITFEKDNIMHMKTITHELLTELIELGKVELDHKPGFFNDREFYRIPLSIQQKLI